MQDRTRRLGPHHLQTPPALNEAEPRLHGVPRQSLGTRAYGVATLMNGPPRMSWISRSMAHARPYRKRFGRAYFGARMQTIRRPC